MFCAPFVSCAAVPFQVQGGRLASSWTHAGARAPDWLRRGVPYAYGHVPVHDDGAIRRHRLCAPVRRAQRSGSQEYGKSREYVSQRLDTQPGLRRVCGTEPCVSLVARVLPLSIDSRGVRIPCSDYPQLLERAVFHATSGGGLRTNKIKEGFFHKTNKHTYLFYDWGISKLGRDRGWGWGRLLGPLARVDVPP